MLGKTYRDKVSGFEGICVGVTEWISGCRTFSLQAKSADGKQGEYHGFDEPRLELLSDAQITITQPETGRVGGGTPPSPKAAPTR